MEEVLNINSLWMQREEAQITEDEKTFSEAIDAWAKNKSGISHPLYVMRTPLALQILGVKDLPVFLSSRKLAQIQHDHPNMTLSIIKQLPRALSDPFLVFKSSTKDGRLVAALELKDESGVNVVVPFELDVDENGIRANIIASAYGKGNDGNINYRWYVNQVASGNTLYWDKEKATAFFASAGVQFSLGAKNGSGFLSPSIKTEDDLVKAKMEKYAIHAEEENIMNLNDTIINLRNLKDEALRLTEDMDYSATLQIVAFCDRAIQEFSKVDNKYGPAFSAYTSEDGMAPSLTLEDIATAEQQEKLMEKLARSVELYAMTFHPEIKKFATPEQIAEDKKKIAEFVGDDKWPSHLFTNAEISLMAERLEKERNSIRDSQSPTEKPQLTEEQKVQIWNAAVARVCKDSGDDFSIHPGSEFVDGKANTYGMVSYDGEERVPYLNEFENFDEAINALEKTMPPDDYQAVMQEMESAFREVQEDVPLPKFQDLDVPDLLDRINGAISKNFVQKLKIQQIQKDKPAAEICETFMNMNVLGKNNDAVFNKWILDEYKSIYETFGSDRPFLSQGQLDSVERRCVEASKPENAMQSMGIDNEDRANVAQFTAYVSGAFAKEMEQRRNMQELINGKYETFTRPIVKFLKATGMDAEKILNVFDGMKRTAEKLLGKSHSAAR